MRQPDTIVINPSRSYPWYGRWTEGDRLTHGQRAAMAKASIDADSVEIIAVRRYATAQELWWPTTQPRPVFEFDCPVLGRQRDGRIRIIAPSGEQALIQGDGWTTAQASNRDQRGKKRKASR